MKAKRMVLLVGVSVLAIILFTAYQPVGAAPPAGEVKSVASNWGTGVPIPSFNISNSNDWMFLLYDFLLGRTPEGRLSTETGLAHKWERSPDGLDWTFYLRKGIKFHDGVELTAKDVKFTIEQLTETGALSDATSDLRRDLKSIEMKDPYTVTIHLKQPNIFLPNLLRDGGLTGMVVPKDYYERVGKDEFAKRPIGSGPYKWHSQMVDSFIKLEAMEKHWRDGVPRYKYMTYLTIPEESTRLAMLRTGEADITSVSRDAVKEAQNVGLDVHTRGYVQAVVLHPGMQWTSPVFSDIRFRKALNLAIDREAIMRQLFAGLVKPMPAYPGSNMFAALGQWVGRDTLTLKPYAYDPQEARRLIKEGGWEGHEFILISLPRPRCPEFPQVVEALAGYWEKVGLKPRIRMTEWAVFRNTWREGKTQNTVFGFDDFPEPDIAALYRRLAERWNGKAPLALFNNPEINKRFERIEKSTEVSEIAKLMAEMIRIVHENYLVIPILEFSEKIATTKRIPPWDMGGRQNDRNYNDLIKQR